MVARVGLFAWDRVLEKIVKTVPGFQEDVLSSMIHEKLILSLEMLLAAG